MIKTKPGNAPLRTLCPSVVVVPAMYPMYRVHLFPWSGRRKQNSGYLPGRQHYMSVGFPSPLSGVP